MARRKNSNPFSDSQEPELSISPLIDVGFLLLIYFLVTTTLAKQELDLNLILPGVASLESEPVKTDQMLIKIDATSTITINEEIVESDPTDRTLKNLKARLETYQAGAIASQSEAMVVISCADDAPEQRFVDVLNACAGVEINGKRVPIRNISLTE